MRSGHRSGRRQTSRHDAWKWVLGQKLSPCFRVQASRKQYGRILEGVAAKDVITGLVSAFLMLDWSVTIVLELICHVAQRTFMCIGGDHEYDLGAGCERMRSEIRLEVSNMVCHTHRHILTNKLCAVRKAADWLEFKFWQGVEFFWNVVCNALLVY